MRSSANAEITTAKLLVRIKSFPRNIPVQTRMRSCWWTLDTDQGKCVAPENCGKFLSALQIKFCGSDRMVSHYVGCCWSIAWWMLPGLLPSFRNIFLKIIHLVIVMKFTNNVFRYLQGLRIFSKCGNNNCTWDLSDKSANCQGDCEPGCICSEDNMRDKNGVPNKRVR